jgi:enediyne biosynthesis protein E4
MRFALLPAVTLLWAAATLTFEATTLPFTHASSPSEKKHLPEAMGSGVALIDIDSDGKLDIFFANGADLETGRKHANKLFRNLGGWRFEDVTAQWGMRGEGFSTGVATGDYDGDGRTDLYVAGYGANFLYRNTGRRFVEVGAQAGVRGAGWSAGAAFLDYDGDGRLDLFVARYVDWDISKSKPCGQPRGYCHPDEFGEVSHLLFRNKGDGTFEDVSQRSGISDHKGKGLGVKIEDVNGDGWPDILVANDSVAQQLFLNRAGKRFEETALASGMAYDDDGNAYAGMGIDVADIDGNGTPDVFVNALARQGYWLYKNDGKGNFTTVPEFARLTEMNSGWGARLADFDNDGRPDLIVAQGHVMDTIEITDPAVKYREPPLLLHNLGGRFTRTGTMAGPAFEEPRAGRALAAGDLDDDGRLDVVIGNSNSAPTLLRNSSDSGNNWIGVRVRGTGAEVFVTTTGGRRLRGYADTSGSYLSASTPLLHFGLGREHAARVEVFWPGGKRSEWQGPASNRVVTLTP